MITQFHVWNNMNSNVIPPAQVAGWNAIPAALKVPATGWPVSNGVDLAAAETRITTNNPLFANDDELGIFVESTIHNWIHGAVSVALDPSDPFIAGFHSPQSTYFYQIHGLVDMWWNRFLHPKTIIKDIIDTNVGKVFIQEVIKQKEIKEHKEIKEFKEKDPKEFKEFKEKDKDLVENIDLNQKINPEILKLQARIQSLEVLVKKGAPFIRLNERPQVGKQVVKRVARKKR